MKINRTRVGRTFKEKLREANDQVWLLDMISFVFDGFLEGPKNSLGQNLTTRDLLPSYQGAHRLDYSLTKLRDFHQQRRHLHLALFLISAFEYASDYIDDVHGFIVKNCGLDVPQKNKLAIEEWVRLSFDALKIGELENKDALLKTLKYFRPMRNSLSHGRGDFRRDFALYAKAEGGSLNAFWSGHQSDDIFHSFVDTDSKEILLAGRVSALIHFLRIVVDELDKAYSSLVKFDHIAPMVYQEVLAANPTMRANKSVLSRKVTTLLEMDFGAKCTDDDVMSKVMLWIDTQ
ncbi:hypothetical protein [Salipiger sp. PrR003]|uniref:hypothetical protein n=1 Tax=Salipiger sp. PrR003 TaxID=2706776 RepID=UPI0013D909ED|nr:hypothetical protein [Salipiger sp. PrR003]NDV52997.1 hypothetical protein [Salipiger sp. PrR003]